MRNANATIAKIFDRAEGQIEGIVPLCWQRRPETYATAIEAKRVR